MFSDDEIQSAAKDFLDCYLELDGWFGDIPDDKSVIVILGLAGFKSVKEYKAAQRAKD